MKPNWLCHIGSLANPQITDSLNQDLVMWQDVEEIKIDLNGTYKTHYAVSRTAYDKCLFLSDFFLK